MKRQYPRIGATCRIGETPQRKCCVCGKPAEFRVDVEYTIFRGDDEVTFVCGVDKTNLEAIDKQIRARLMK